MRATSTQRQINRLLLGLAAGLMLAGLLVGCGDSTPTTAGSSAGGVSPAPAGPGNSTGVSDTEIVLGSWGPQSGPTAAYGVVDRAIAAYFKKVNEEGGINGRKISFKYEDDGYNSARTIGVVKKLIEQDKVFALVGGLGTDNNLAVMDYLVSNNIPHVAPATGASGICCQPLKKNIFALQTNYQVEATLLTRYGIDNLKLKKAAVFYQNDPFGTEGFENIQAELKARALPPAVGVSYAKTDKDFSSQALVLRQSGADTLLMWSTPQPTAGLLKEIEKLGWKPTVIMSVTNNDPVLLNTAGSAIEGAWSAAWLPDPNGDDPKSVRYREFMKKYMPEEAIGSFTVVGMAYGELMSEALRRAGRNLTRESLIAALETFKDWNEGLPYKVNYSPTNRQGQNALYVLQAKDGKWLRKSDVLELKPR